MKALIRAPKTEIPASRMRIPVRPMISTVVGVGALLVGACSPPPPDEAAHLDRLIEDRALKDQAFKENNDSPVPLDRRSWMLPLRYYEPDLAYRVPAQLRTTDEQPVFQVPTSTGQLRSVQRVGHLEFRLNGNTHTLSALVELPIQDAGRLIVPFRDGTSGTETYSGGRYLDLYRTPTGIYDLDFNRAYTPYCYYNEEYECLFPPPENRLATDIRAGERLVPEDESRFPVNKAEPPEAASPDAASGD